MVSSTHDLGRRFELASAADMVDIAEWVAANDPARRAATAPLRGGQVALTGIGLFVNAAMACGLDQPLTNADLDVVEELSSTAGVVPSVQVSEFTHPNGVAVLTARGYAPDDERPGVVHNLTDLSPATETPFIFEVVESDAELGEWQHAAAESWGHHAPERRAASDTFAAAAHAVQTPGLILVRDGEDRRVVACTALSIRDGLAILGGMSTLPSERNRGVQRACIEHRLQLAVASECTGAATQAVNDGSLRNLLRCGFTPSHTTTSWELSRS